MGSFTDWQNSVVGKQIDVDGAYGDQCVDIAESYCKYFWPNHNWPEELGYGNAKDLYSASNPNYFQKIPYYPGLIAQQGDLIVYGATTSNPYGHIAAVISGTATDVVVVEQNGFNPTGVAYITHRTYANCIGLLRPIGVNEDMGQIEELQGELEGERKGYQALLDNAISIADAVGVPHNPGQYPGDQVLAQVKELQGEHNGYPSIVKDIQALDDALGLQHGADSTATNQQRLDAINALKTAPAPSDGGFTPADRATLNWIQKAIASVFRIPV